MSVTVRRVGPADIPAVVALVHDLARYERAAEQCKLTDDQLSRSLFSDRPALFGHVGEVDGEVVGFALWFLNYSTWTGEHGIHLEDLFVRPEHRRSGLGRALLTELARICRSAGYTRLEWGVLNWNVDAHRFYRSLSAEPMDDWTGWRLSGDRLAELAEQ
ncbi:MAG TPA: GNAT family N-acetyltransferase [Mycobacteriales bacterium]